jgi:hypothetical protein
MTNDYGANWLSNLATKQDLYSGGDDAPEATANGLSSGSGHSGSQDLIGAARSPVTPAGGIVRGGNSGWNEPNARRPERLTVGEDGELKALSKPTRPKSGSEHKVSKPSPVQPAGRGIEKSDNEALQRLLTGSGSIDSLQFNSPEEEASAIFQQQIKNGEMPGGDTTPAFSSQEAADAYAALLDETTSAGGPLGASTRYSDFGSREAPRMVEGDSSRKDDIAGFTGSNDTWKKLLIAIASRIRLGHQGGGGQLQHINKA